MVPVGVVDWSVNVTVTGYNYRMIVMNFASGEARQ
jgi:hypothetical protein